MNSYPTRWSRQLRAIIEIIYDAKGPLTADQVYEIARETMPRISLGTVYRNLNRLVAVNLISETKVGTIQCFFSHPYTNTHLECRICGKLYNVHYELPLSQVIKETGLRIEGWELRLKGVCKECESKCI